MEMKKQMEKVIANIERSGLESIQGKALNTQTAWEWQEFANQNIQERTVVPEVRQSWYLRDKMVSKFTFTDKFEANIPKEWADMGREWGSEILVCSENCLNEQTVGTDNINLKTFKYSSKVCMSWEMMKTWVINMEQYVRNKFDLSFKAQKDNSLLNSDTDLTAANVSQFNWAPVANTPLTFRDGLRRKALIDNPNGVINAWVLDKADLLQTRMLLGDLRANDPSKLLWIIDPYTYSRLLELQEIETIEKFGNDAVIKTWSISSILGSEIIVMPQFGKTDINGYYDVGTPANNTQWSLLSLYVPDVHLAQVDQGLRLYVKFDEDCEGFEISAHANIGAVVQEDISVGAAVNVTI